MVVALVNLLFGIVETIISLRFILKLFAASPDVPFVGWVYSVTSSLISPFVGIFPDLRTGVYIIEITSLFAILIYMIAGFLIIEFFSLIFRTRP